jgi:hypothetical protein
MVELPHALPSCTVKLLDRVMPLEGAGVRVAEAA